MAWHSDARELRFEHMQASFTTVSTPGRANEDYVAAGSDWAVILDGATAPVGVDSGCIHDVRWLVHQLAAAVISHLIVSDRLPLTELLAGAIKETCDKHSATCDLSNPDSPSATISIVRMRDEVCDYLTLGDSPIVFWHRNQTFTLVADDRTSHLPGGRPYTMELERAYRNRPGGYWVASTLAEAAYQAISGETPVGYVSEIGLFTDGVTRLLDWYGHTWPMIFSALRSEGPGNLIALVRAAEREQPRPNAKQHDDASAIYLTIS